MYTDAHAVLNDAELEVMDCVISNSILKKQLLSFLNIPVLLKEWDKDWKQYSCKRRLNKDRC
jgi:hypothetical protein